MNRTKNKQVTIDNLLPNRIDNQPVEDALQRFDFIYNNPDNHRAVRLGILRILAGCRDFIDDYTLEDIEADTWVAVWDKLEGLSQPSKNGAKLTTRLSALAKFQAMAWRQQKVRAQKKYRAMTKAVKRYFGGAYKLA